MITGISEHKVQTAIQSNVHVAQYGTVTASNGDNTITFPKKFLTRPVVIVNGTIEASGASAQPIVYVESFNQDSNNYYESMVVYSDATAQNIDWVAIGIIK